MLAKSTPDFLAAQFMKAPHTHTHTDLLRTSPTTGRSMPRTLKSAQTKRPREERKRKQLREKTL